MRRIVQEIILSRLLHYFIFWCRYCTDISYGSQESFRRHVKKVHAREYEERMKRRKELVNLGKISLDEYIIEN